MGCTSLKKVVLDKGVSEISLGMFSECNNLSSIVIPDSVSIIGNAAFYGCYSLNDVFYTGVERQVKYISVGTGNDELNAATWHYSYKETAFYFRDVMDSSRYYYTPVYWAVERGIIVGYGGKDLFSPDAPCTREQIVTFLWRLMGEPEPGSIASFTDVSSGAWYEKPISWAFEKGITVGLNDGTGRFGVGQPCTREMCVTFLWRAAGKPAPASYSSFTDVASDRYFYDAVSWAAARGITVGLNDGTGRFGVGTPCSRAMIVTFLYRFAT